MYSIDNLFKMQKRIHTKVVLGLNFLRGNYKISKLVRLVHRHLFKKCPKVVFWQTFLWNNVRDNIIQFLPRLADQVVLKFANFKFKPFAGTHFKKILP